MTRDTRGKPVEPMKMAHMERKGDKDEAMMGGSKYPHGLRIHVDHEGMKSMGIEDMPQVGHSVEMRAKAQVMGVHMEDGEDGKPRHRMEMQITHMGISHKPDGMKSEDQGGSGKTLDAGKVTEKRGTSAGQTAKEPNYGRKRN